MRLEELSNFPKQCSSHLCQQCEFWLPRVLACACLCCSGYCATVTSLWFPCVVLNAEAKWPFICLPWSNAVSTLSLVFDGVI